MKKPQQTKKRYEKKLPPANSFAFSESPLNTTTRVRVRRWHDYSGKPTLFQVVNEGGHVLFNHPYEPDALAHCEALELALAMERLVDEVVDEIVDEGTEADTESVAP